MEIGQCEMMLLAVVGFVITACIGTCVYYTISHFWNKPPSGPSNPTPKSIVSKALRYMKVEANRLGVTKYRIASIATCVFLFSFYTWGSITSYNNVTLVDCGKGDIAIEIPDSAKNIIVAIGLPCGCEK